MPSAYDTQSLQGTPIGATLPLPTTGIPIGYLICDGASLLRAGPYADLYAAIGVAHGTLDSTHFNIPDYRGRFLRHQDTGVGRDPDRAGRSLMATGGNPGDAVGSVQGHGFQSHTHQLTAPATWGTGPLAAGVRWSSENTSTGNATATMTETGGNETRPVNINTLYMIRYK